MDIADLGTFLAVADAGSFSVAAERLHLSQPAVSKRIANLESGLGARLFDRLGRTVVPTEAGRTLLPRARRILQETDDCRRALANLSGRVGGRLSIATSHHIGLHRLPPVLKAFAARYPGVSLDLSFTDSELGCESVAHGGAELAIVTLPPAEHPALHTRVIWEDRLAVAVHQGHPLAARDPVPAASLARHPAILPGPETFTRRLIDAALAPARVELAVAFSTNYLETIKMMVSVGLGWSLLPRVMLGGETPALELEGDPITRSLGIVRHRARTLSNAARAMLETVEEAASRRERS